MEILLSLVGAVFIAYHIANSIIGATDFITKISPKNILSSIYFMIRKNKKPKLDCNELEARHKQEISQAYLDIKKYSITLEHLDFKINNLVKEAELLFLYWKENTTNTSRFIHFQQSYYKTLPELMKLYITIIKKGLTDTPEAKEIEKTIKNLAQCMHNELKKYYAEETERMLQAAKIEVKVMNQIIAQDKKWSESDHLDKIR